jgi:hypothetical protein
MTHKHHIVPRHMTGDVYDNSPDNITPPISVAMHAALHKDLFEYYGKTEDFLAWKNLEGSALKGIEFTLEYREKLSKSHLNMSNETKQKIRKSLMGNKRALGYKHTEETKNKMSEKRKGCVFSEEHIKHLKISRKHQVISKGKIAWNKGKKCPQISAALKGKPLSDERKKNMSIGHMGIIFTPKHKKNMSISASLRWARMMDVKTA